MEFPIETPTGRGSYKIPEKLQQAIVPLRNHRATHVLEEVVYWQ